MTGIYDNRLGFHELPFYEIEGLCEELVRTATSKSEKYKEIFEEYKRNMSRFSPAFEFCIHELGWMLYDPFSLGTDEVLFSNGKRCFVASVDYVKKEGFDRHSITNDTAGYPRLYDDVIGYDPYMSVDNINEGIVDEKGFVSSTFTDSIDILAEIEVMFDNISDKKAYKDYQKNKYVYDSKLEYLTSKKNVMSAKKLEDGSVSLNFVSENDGIVQEFVDFLESEGKLASYIPVVGSEKTDIMKVA
ncbi:MAG: hypothetical protein J1F35_01435 [Erysipelotrichales bacterium]|nr:hypothetical protein [Erysipelotrichales bacterium]